MYDPPLSHTIRALDTHAFAWLPLTRNEERVDDLELLGGLRVVHIYRYLGGPEGTSGERRAHPNWIGGHELQ